MPGMIWAAGGGKWVHQRGCRWGSVADNGSLRHQQDGRKVAAVPARSVHGRGPCGLNGRRRGAAPVALTSGPVSPLQRPVETLAPPQQKLQVHKHFTVCFSFAMFTGPCSVPWSPGGES